ncbi:FG-GAP repeat domain-containing protein [Streptomyces sp. NPDC056525]|uniref:FG-GAP repeat domain-containing protein n=1 Tax=unclassified Streptomyces TaxID=2593676 RepID=UPI003684FE91
MDSSHIFGGPARRVGTAVVAALLLAGALPAAVAEASAGTTAVSATTATAGAPLIKPGDMVTGLGRTGFLTWATDGTYTQRWTRLADGAVTVFPSGHSVSRSIDSDVVVDQRHGVATLRDMEAGTELFSLPLDSNRYAGAVRSTLFARADISGRGPLELYSPGTDGPVRRTATGLPADAADLGVVAASGNDALLMYTTGSGTAVARHWAVLDLNSAAVTSSRRIAATDTNESVSFAISTTHIAWTDYSADNTGTTVVVLDRTTLKTQSFRMASAARLLIGLVGNWLTYSRPGGLLSYSRDTVQTLTARSLTSTATRKLLDHTVSSVDAPGDAAGFVGGTTADGEGLYRIAPGADGVPAATNIATTGAPTQVTLLGHTVPTTVDLDRTGGQLPLAWHLSRNNVAMTLTLRNTRTGESLTEYVTASTRDESPQPMRYDWTGALRWNNEPGTWTGASAGPYTWQITAKPLNGIGPDLKASGSFTVTRKTGAHDYDSDGSPDILARDTSGRLWIQDTYRQPASHNVLQNRGLVISGGWQVYDRIEATGNLGGAAAPDLVARDRDGMLWLYLGTGDGKAPFTGRIRISAGWNTYVHLAAGSDLTADGRPDLVATDPSGRLWLHRGTGVASAPFAPRKLIGTGGWQAYDRITALGNLAGGAAGDLVARDKAGVLWLHLGNGDGTLAPRTRISGGWNGFDDLVGSGDLDRDGRPDLYAGNTNGTTHTPGTYRATGDWRTPLRAFEKVNTVQTGQMFNLFA